MIKDKKLKSRTYASIGTGASFSSSSSAFNLFFLRASASESNFFNAISFLNYTIKLNIKEVKENINETKQKSNKEERKFIK